MHEIAEDALFPLAKAAAHLKRTLGVAVHVSTLHRWRDSGVAGRRLKCKRIGGRWYTSLSKLQEFFADSGASGTPHVPSHGRAARAQKRLADEFSA